MSRKSKTARSGAAGDQVSKPAAEPKAEAAIDPVSEPAAGDKASLFLETNAISKELREAIKARDAAMRDHDAKIAAINKRYVAAKNRYLSA